MKGLKVESREITAYGGLYSAYQIAKVIVKNRVGNEQPKLGIEIRMVPIKDGEEQKDRFKPKSFFVKKGELRKFDDLLFEMIKFRWYFAKITGTLTTGELSLDQMVEYFVRKVRHAIMEGLRMR